MYTPPTNPSDSGFSNKYVRPGLEGGGAAGDGVYVDKVAGEQKGS